MLFASINSLKFETTSRRDDLISICYILIYLIDNRILSFINNVQDMSLVQKFKYVRKQKFSHCAMDLCGNSETHPKTYRLYKFVDDIFNLKFDETPNYSKLIF